MPDLKASVSFTADGTTKKYYFNFDYINPEYIKVNVGGTELSYPSDYSVIDRAVELAEVPAKDMLIQVYRQTPSDRLIEWADGAFIKAAQMSLSDLQQLHLIEESQDYIILNCISSYPDGKNFNALGHRIINVADPVDTQDAVTKHYMESVQDGFVQRNQAIETHVQKMQTDVTQKQQAAAQSASKAATSETNAAESENNAAASEEAAAASEQAAATSERNAATSEGNAEASEVAAKTSETNAKTSETNAKTSELNAASSETNAAASESAAAASETNAANSELMAQKWAESPTSPDGNDDSASDTGKTQSAKEWAKQAERAAQVFQDFTGATSTEDGTAGKVPQPKAGQQSMFLSGGGGFKKAVTKVNNSYTPDNNGNISLPFVDTSTQQTIEGKKEFTNIWLLAGNTTTEGGELHFYAPNNPLSAYGGFDLFKRDANYYMRIIDYGLTGGGTLVPFQFNLNSGDMLTLKGVTEQRTSYSFGSTYKYIRYASGLQLCWFTLLTTSNSQTITLPVSFTEATAIISDVGAAGTTGGVSLGAQLISGNTLRLSNRAGVGVSVIVIGYV